MKSLTKIVLVAGIGLLALLPISLEAQKGGPRLKKVNDDYCLSKDGKQYDKNVYTKSIIGKPTFISKEARNYNKKVYADMEKNKANCVHKQENIYRAHKR